MKNYLENILAITGQTGLFKLISNAQNRNSIIVESLITKKRMPIFSTASVSTLKDVSIYTDSEGIALKIVLENIFEKYNGQQIFTNKPTNQDLLAFMENVLPEYDKEKVYISDIKKLVVWYNSLIENNIITKEAIEESNKTDETSETAETVNTENQEITE